MQAPISHSRGKKKKSQESYYLSCTSKAFPFTKLQGHPILFSTPTEDHPSPYIISLLAALFLSVQKSLQAGGTMIQEATPAKFSSTRTGSLAGTEQHPRCQLQGMFISAPGQQGSFSCTEIILVFIPLLLHQRPQPWDVGCGMQSKSFSRKVGMHFSSLFEIKQVINVHHFATSTHYLI